MNWNYLEKISQLTELSAESNEKDILIFKHSTRCSVSRMVLDRLERNWKDGEVNLKPYFLDLITYREISNAIAHQYDVLHESPQVLIIKKGKSVFDCSHTAIDFNTIKECIKN